MNFKTLFPVLTDGQLAQLRRLIAEEVIGFNEYGNIGYVGEDFVDETSDDDLVRNAFRDEQRTKLDKLFKGEK